MKRIFTNKKIISMILTLALLIGMALGLTGCNKQVIDFDYTYNKLYCNYNGDKFELDIDQWKDYDGEQIQIKANGKKYLVSANQCYLVGE